MKKYKLGFIGCGNMATAIWKGCIESGYLSSSELAVCDVDSTKTVVAESCGISVLSGSEIFTSCQYVVLAVKPQSFSNLCQEYAGVSQADCVISIMAGVSIASLVDGLKIDKICRVMPNTPVMKLKGMSSLSFHNCNEENLNFIYGLFQSLGEVIVVPENLIHTVVSLSGSGPAYVYAFLQALINGAVEDGLTFEQAKTSAIQTLIGACSMVGDASDLSTLIDEVCSKGGTTIQAIEYFRNHNFEDIVKGAMRASGARSFEMENNTKNANSSELKEITIYTDGACSVNPGPGGWAAILMYNGVEKEISGGESETTNNRMELMAVISGLKALKLPRCKVNLYSDSAYVVNAVEQGWVYGWKNRGWKTAGKEEVKNVDLWQELLVLLSKHKVTFYKVKGHADNEFNNRCDKLAREEAIKHKAN